MADRLADTAAVGRVLMHEALGHFGLRGVYGDNLGAVLDRMAVLNAAKVREAATRLGLDFGAPRDGAWPLKRRWPTWPSTPPSLAGVGKAVAAIRSWLRDNIPGFSNMQMSDQELVRDYLLPARKWVEDGGPTGSGPGRSGSKAAFSLSGKEARNALKELSAAADMFALAKSKEATLEGIARDNIIADTGDGRNTGDIKVRKGMTAGLESLYVITFGDGTEFKLWERKPSPMGRTRSFTL